MKCKKSVVAKKQFTVYRAPIITTFQLKRFECVRTIGKIMKAISYPEVLDLRPYMSENVKIFIYFIDYNFFLIDFQQGPSVDVQIDLGFSP